MKGGIVYIMEKLDTNLKECKRYVDTIMPDVLKILDYNAIWYIVDSKNTEITINECPMTKDELEILIESSLDIPKIVSSILLKYKEAKGKIFIRLQYQ